jgi:hypothetical protein
MGGLAGKIHSYSKRVAYHVIFRHDTYIALVHMHLRTGGSLICMTLYVWTSPPLDFGTDGTRDSGKISTLLTIDQLNKDMVSGSVQFHTSASVELKSKEGSPRCIFSPSPMWAIAVAVRKSRLGSILSYACHVLTAHETREHVMNPSFAYRVRYKRLGAYCV